MRYSAGLLHPAHLHRLLQDVQHLLRLREQQRLVALRVPVRQHLRARQTLFCCLPWSRRMLQQLKDFEFNCCSDRPAPHSPKPIALSKQPLVPLRPSPTNPAQRSP